MSSFAITTSRQPGIVVDQVALDIDYRIIQHFSEHLYGSPNKAIEELVSNGFDAFGTEVYVYVPGRFTTDHVLVWDNGDSMDIDGLKMLWHIARSPKAVGDRVVSRGTASRKLIGKFGIGKLASYAVGDTIAHLCRRNSNFWLVGVDYANVHHSGKELEEKGASTKADIADGVYRTPILQLTESEARQYLAGLFIGDTPPAAVDAVFGKESWTLAIVSGLKKNIPAGRLSWVIGNGMPLRPDFRVWINDDPVKPSLAKDAQIEWDFGSPDIQSALRAAWEDDKNAGRVTGEIAFGTKTGLDPFNSRDEVPFVDFPSLGKIWGKVRLFDRSLASGRAAEYDRSHGFFLYVRERLLNQDDETVLLKPPSFGAFYRSQFVLNVDGLDEELLADRERFRQETESTAELGLLQAALYRKARSTLESRDAEAAEQSKTLAILPVKSREHFREPLTALLVRDDNPERTFNLGHPTVNRKPLGAAKRTAVLSDAGFEINTSHPYYKALENKVGDTKRSQEFYRAYSLMAISDLLLEGHLYDIGLSDDQVATIVTWKDGLLREMADIYDGVPSDLTVELVNSSYLGKKEFEEAIAKVVRSMGFQAHVNGSSGAEDILVAATNGPDGFVFTFEGKGSKNAIANDAAEVAGAASHRDKVGASHAVIIAREFAGFKRTREEGAAIISECKSVGGVSIMQVDALLSLAAAAEEFAYPLDILKDTLTIIESPDDKMLRIQSLAKPTSGFDFQAVLEEIWARQAGEAIDDTVPYQAVMQSRPEWKALGLNMFEAKLAALETLAGARIRLLTNTREVYLRTAPHLIVEQVERALAGESTTFTTHDRDRTGQEL